MCVSKHVRGFLIVKTAGERRTDPKRTNLLFDDFSGDALRLDKAETKRTSLVWVYSIRDPGPSRTRFAPKHVCCVALLVW